MTKAWAVLILFLMAAAASAEPRSADEKRQQLETLRERIGKLEETLARTRGQKTGLLQDLEGIERRVGVLTRLLRDLELDLVERQQALERLQEERRIREQRLQGQREVLGRELRGAYITGRQERLRILLSQEDPGLVSRIMAYHGYLSRARVERIRSIHAQVAELRGVAAAVAEERAQIARLRSERQAEQQVLEAARAGRRDLADSLDRELQKQDAALRSLKLDAEELQALIERLDTELDKVEIPQREPFSSYKGRLAWPVSGRLSARFGTQRASGGLSWDGVVIKAAEGTEVRAIYHGRVAFADWLRGFGLLLILDHGEGYMSLYGFNQTLLKETGEWVEQGEEIALVGDSGGRNHASLYFGVRLRGRPQNPRLWCRRLKGENTVSALTPATTALAYNRDNPDKLGRRRTLSGIR